MMQIRKQELQSSTIAEFNASPGQLMLKTAKQNWFSVINTSWMLLVPVGLSDALGCRAPVLEAKRT